MKPATPGLADRLRSIPASVRWLLTGACAATIVVLSITPDQYEAGDSVFHWLVANTLTPLQKALHVITYGVLTVLLAWSLDAFASRRRRLVLTASLPAVLGAALEWAQLFVPGRFGSLYDILLNCGGVILGLVLARLLS